jgi:uncharacterized protein YjbI with pentapeptide repeats
MHAVCLYSCSLSKQGKCVLAVCRLRATRYNKLARQNIWSLERGALLAQAYRTGAFLEQAYRTGALLEEAYRTGAFLEQAYRTGALLEEAYRTSSQNSSFTVLHCGVQSK